MDSKRPINLEKIIENISKTDAKDLILIAKYYNNKKKYQKIQIYITSSIATMTGAAILMAYTFPSLENKSVALYSIIIAFLTVTISFWQRKKYDHNIFAKYLKTIDNPSESDLKEAELFRKEFIDSLKAEEK